MDYRERVRKAEAIARQAGDIIMRVAREGKGVEYKSEINLVTRADLESEQFVFEELSRAFPQDAIVAEEGKERSGSSGFTWIVDPLDGTTSFAHGFPFFAVSIGLVDSSGKPVLGAIYSPMLDELFCAYQGGGAFLNGAPIEVSKTPSLKEALIGTGFPYNRREIMERILGRLERMLYIVHDVRRTGSAALDICYVAAGRLDAYYEEGLQPWDTAAALAVLHEAGGMATLFDGSQFDIYIPEVAVSNRAAHQELLQAIQEPA